MSISTKENSLLKLNKKERKLEIQKFHKETLNAMGIERSIIIPKIAYRPQGKEKLHISLFPSEVNYGQDLYIEFTSRDNVPDDFINRTLYRWRYNPHYAEEYEMTEPHPGGTTGRYLIPVDELIVIKEYGEDNSIATEEIEFDDLPDPDEDLPISQLTIRDLAAIIRGKPISKKKWLNDIL